MEHLADRTTVLDDTAPAGPRRHLVCSPARGRRRPDGGAAGRLVPIPSKDPMSEFLQKPVSCRGFEHRPVCFRSLASSLPSSTGAGAPPPFAAHLLACTMTCGPVVVLLDYGGLCQKILVSLIEELPEIPGRKCLRHWNCLAALMGSHPPKSSALPHQSPGGSWDNQSSPAPATRDAFLASPTKVQDATVPAISSLLPPPEVRVIYPARPCRNGSASPGLSHLMLEMGRRADARRS